MKKSILCLIVSVFLLMSLAPCVSLSVAATSELLFAEDFQQYDTTTSVETTFPKQGSALMSGSGDVGNYWAHGHHYSLLQAGTVVRGKLIWQQGANGGIRSWVTEGSNKAVTLSSSSSGAARYGMFSGALTRAVTLGEASADDFVIFSFDFKPLAYGTNHGEPLFTIGGTDVNGNSTKWSSQCPLSINYKTGSDGANDRYYRMSKNLPVDAENGNEKKLTAELIYTKTEIGRWEHITTVVDVKNQKFHTIINGKVHKDFDLPTSMKTLELFGFNSPVTGYSYALDNIKVYAADAAFAMTGCALQGAADVSLNSDIVLNFSKPIADTTQLENISVTAGGEAVDKSRYSLSLQNPVDAVGSSVILHFESGLKGSTDYVVNIPALKAEDGTMSAASAVSFRTESAPAYSILLSGVESLSGLGGKTISCTAKAKNTSEKTTMATVFVGLYDATGNLVRYSFTESSFVPAQEEVFTWNFVLPQDVTGMKLKAFVCSSIYNLANRYSEQDAIID